MAGTRCALIFGANGFVGSYLAAELKAHGYRVCGSDLHEECFNSSVDCYAAADVTDFESVMSVMSECAANVVINLAAISSVGQSWRNPQVTVRVNVMGALNILEAAKAQECRPKVLLVGSSEEYAPSDRPLNEECEISANSPYGISKVTQESFARLYREKFGVPVYQARSFNHTGPGQSPMFVLPSWCKQVADIERGIEHGFERDRAEGDWAKDDRSECNWLERTLRVGNIRVSRDFSDVRDIVRGYRLLIESDYCGEVFNFGSGRALPLSELLDCIVGFSQKEIIVEVDDSLFRPGDNEYLCCDYSKAREKLGWVPEHRIEDTLALMYQEFMGAQ